jgi:CRISPR/Cas system-associated exonuclease Cas4 (RecB family)
VRAFPALLLFLEESTMTLSLERMREGLHLSASALKTFLSCPWKFRLRYVDGAKPEFQPSALILGKAVHAALAEHHLSLMKDTRLAPDTVLTCFDENLNREAEIDLPIQFTRCDDLDSLRETGRGLVEVYLKEAKTGKILAVEQPFQTSLVDPRTGEELEPKLVGFFDLIEEDEDGNVSVVEIKTAARKWSAGQVEMDLQGSLYAAAVSRSGLAPDGREARLRYDILVKNKKPILDRQHAIRTPKERHMALCIAVDALKAIEGNAFYRNPGWQCSGCQYRRTCGI